MENSDPNMIGVLVESQPIILFDNASVGESSGETPSTIAEMAKNAASFIFTLGLRQVDILCFSMGGFVAQELVMQRLDLIRRLVLAGTAPKSGVGLHFRHDVYVASTNEDANGSFERFMFLFYPPAEVARVMQPS